MQNNVVVLDNRLALLDFVDVRGKECAEIGVAKGEYSAAILSRNPQKLYLIDPWVRQSTEWYPDDHANLSQQEFDATFREVVSSMPAEKVEILREYSLFASCNFGSQCLDFVYVDAIHTYENCLVDIISWFPKVRNGGWLCGHDYTGNYAGVRAAVDAFVKISNQELAILTSEPWGSWGIRVDLSRRPR